MREQVTIDLLDAFKFLVGNLFGGEDPWVSPIKAINVVDVIKVYGITQFPLLGSYLRS